MIEQLLLQLESPKKPIQAKAALGQFFTPPEIARFMAILFSEVIKPSHLLDPGTGQGMLAKAFRERFPDLSATTLIERDPSLIPRLKSSFLAPDCNILNEDFIGLGSRWVAAGKRPFSHAILNPPTER